MQTAFAFFKNFLFLLLLSQIPKDASCIIPSPLSPSYWLGKLPNPMNVMLHLMAGETVPRRPRVMDTGPIVETKMVKPHGPVFTLASNIQSFFDPSDIEAKENYIISPVAASTAIGELCMGVRGPQYDLLGSLLGFSKRARRGVFIYEESPEELYNDELAHAAYHFALKALARKEQTDEHEDKVQFYNALFYRDNASLVEHFIDHLLSMYATDIMPVDANDLVTSTNIIQQWTVDKLNSTVFTKPLNPGFGSQFLSAVEFRSTWRFPLEKSTKLKEQFSVKPYQQEAVKYLEGVIENATYVDTDDFTLVGIPLNHKETELFILLPKGRDFVMYNIRGFSESLNVYTDFMSILNNNKRYEDVKIKVPDIFNQVVQIDIQKPLMNYINDEFQLRDMPLLAELQMNGAAANLSVNNIVQQVHFQIDNPTEKPTEPTTTTTTTARSETVDRNIEVNTDSSKIETKSNTDSTETETKVNNDGTETETNTSTPSSDTIRRKRESSVIEFDVVRPFVFIVMDREKQTNVVILWGSISDPTKLQK